MAMMKFRDPRRREGYEFRRVLVARGDLARFVPDAGWEIESYGRPFENPGQSIALTLRRPLPPLVRPDNILDLARDLLEKSGQCTISWMAGSFGLAEYELLAMLREAGVPKLGSERPWFREGDRLFWLDNRNAATRGIKLRSKRIERDEEFYDG